MTELFSYGKHEDLGGGRFRTTLGLRPVNYLSSGGGYLPINNDWEDGDQDNPHVVSATPMRVRADGNGRRNLYPIPGNDEVYISIGRPWAIIGGSWQPAPLNPLERQGGRLQSINNNYNLYLDHAGHYAKLGILLKNGFVPTNNRFSFPVSLVGLARQGSAILHNGTPIMTLRPPVVYDWQNPEDVRPITFNFVTFNGQTGVVFILPDLSGMSLPLVDPTLVLQPGAADGLMTRINELAPTTNYGTDATNIVGGTSGSGTRTRILLRVPLDSLPDAAQLSSTDLEMFLASENGTHAENPVTVHRLLTTWTEGGATWNSRDGSNNWTAAGGFDPADCEQTSIGSVAFNANPATNQFYSWSLAGATKADIDAGDGWMFRGGGTGSLFFASDDNATAENRPKLTIEYTLPAGGIFKPGVLNSAIFGGTIVG